MYDWDYVVRPRRATGQYERGRVFVGEAGIGKSTLVRKIAFSAKSRGDWVTPQLRIALGEDPIKALAAALLELAKESGVAKVRRLKTLLERVNVISAYGMSLTLDKSAGQEPHRALCDLLIEIGKAAFQKNKVVLIHIDEVQNITKPEAMSQLLITLGDAIGYEWHISVNNLPAIRYLPVAIYLTGLPEFLDMVGADKGATFSRRFLIETLASLPDEDISAALHRFVFEGWHTDGGLVWFAPDAAATLTSLCRGEPFLFQLCGERSWYAGQNNIITANDVLRGWSSMEKEALSHVARVIDRLPERERGLIEAMAELPADKRNATAIASVMGFTDASSIGSAAQRLELDRGLISRGKPYAFTNAALEAYLTSEWPSLNYLSERSRGD
jgi:hypothetical protein